jgi:hypothetical protein
MPPQMLNGFEMALRGRMDNLPQAISGEVRDDVYDAVASYRDMMVQANRDRKMDHLMGQGYTKEEVEGAMVEKRKEYLMTEMAKPTPVAPVSIESALMKVMKRDYGRTKKIPEIDENPSMVVV